MVDVSPTWRTPRCSGCGTNCPGYDRLRGRRWRHLDLAGMKWHLRYDTRRVDCPCCGVVVEHVPWADVGSWFTRPFEDQVGYLAQRSDKTTVRKLMRIAWTTVGEIIQRVVQRHQRGDLLDGFTHIGVDELSYRRHHEYVTVVVDHKAQRIVWAKKGKNAATLVAFFDELGPERVAKLEAVTIDMSAAYIKAVTAAAPNAQLIFDRFHVQRLVHDALDQVRRAEVREDPTPATRKALKGTRWPLLRRAWNLKDLEICKLAALPRINRRLFRAYLLKESLAAILDRKQVHVARRKLDEWIRWAFRAQLAPFRRVAATLRDHKEGILAYISSRLEWSHRGTQRQGSHYHSAVLRFA
ncbi:MAG: ISL3 family transposase [Myxococcales bacterium]|nr:ISL3 family transposase [Myxococcales bacterium]